MAKKRTVTQVRLEKVFEMVETPRERLTEAEATLRCLLGAMEVELHPDRGGNFSLTLVLEGAIKLVARSIDDLDRVKLSRAIGQA